MEGAVVVGARLEKDTVDDGVTREDPTRWDTPMKGLLVAGPFLLKGVGRKGIEGSPSITLIVRGTSSVVVDGASVVVGL